MLCLGCMLDAMRTTIRLSDDLPRRAKKRAAEKGRTLTSLIEDGLKIILAEPRRAPHSRVRLPISTASGGTVPGVDLNPVQQTGRPDGQPLILPDVNVLVNACRPDSTDHALCRRWLKRGRQRRLTLWRLPTSSKWRYSRCDPPQDLCKTQQSC